MATVYEKASDESGRSTVQPGASNSVRRAGAGEAYGLGGGELHTTAAAAQEGSGSPRPAQREQTLKSG